MDSSLSEIKTSFSKLLTLVLNSVYRVEEQYVLDDETFERIEDDNSLMPKIVEKRCKTYQSLVYYE